MRLFRYDCVDSTNEVAKRLLRQGRIGTRACVCAEEQTAGKGSRGRTWVSPRGAGIYLSVVHAGPSLPARVTPIFTLAAGIACAETLWQTAGVRIGLKPVNDLYAHGRKLGGVLTESWVENGRMLALITGIGMNIRQCDIELPPGSVPATNLQTIMPSGAFANLDLANVVRSISENLDRWYRLIFEGNGRVVHETWLKHCVLRSGRGDLKC